MILTRHSCLLLQKLPLVAERSACGYVGLRNASATCYMNSVLQQFHMVSGIKEVSGRVSVLFVDICVLVFGMLCVLVWLVMMLVPALECCSH